MASLKAKLFSAAAAFAPLIALLQDGSPASFRWFDQQLPQKPSAEDFPCIVVSQISNPRTYAYAGRLPTGFSLMRFRIFTLAIDNPDSQQAEQIAETLVSFLDQFSGGSGIPGQSQYSNLVVSDVDGGIAATKPLTFQRIIDAQIFNNDLV